MSETNYMERKFKVGDRVKIVKREKDNQTGAVDWNKPNGDVGKIGFVASIKNHLSDGPYEVRSEANEMEGRYFGYFSEREIVLVKKSPEQNVLAPKFALQYELDSDPVEFFATLSEVKRRIKELAERSDLKRDSLMVYEIKSVQKVELGVSMTFKKV